MKSWAKSRESWLRENYNNYTNKELGVKLGVSESSIEHKLKRLNLKNDVKKRGWTWRNGHPKGFSGKTHSKSARKKMSEASINAWANPDSIFNTWKFRQSLSDRAIKTQKNISPEQRHSFRKGGKRKDLGIYVRSSWEANFARYLNWVKERGDIKKWEYEPDTFDFPIKRGTRFYTPDFKVWENDGSVIYYEVKGWMTQRGETALKRMAKYYPEIKLVLFDKRQYKELSKWRRLIPNWE